MSTTEIDRLKQEATVLLRRLVQQTVKWRGADLERMLEQQKPMTKTELTVLRNGPEAWDISLCCRVLFLTGVELPRGTNDAVQVIRVERNKWAHDEEVNLGRLKQAISELRKSSSPSPTPSSSSSRVEATKKPASTPLAKHPQQQQQQPKYAVPQVPNVAPKRSAPATPLRGDDTTWSWGNIALGVTVAVGLLAAITLPEPHGKNRKI